MEMAVLSSGVVEWPMTRKIIIDTDPGIDDAMAIFFALASPEIEVVGVTTIFGNAHTDVTTRNALSLLEIAERSDIPVAAGASKPISSEFRGPAASVHGEDGQGNVGLPTPKTQPIEKRACDFIVETVMDDPGAITLVPIGPLTNIAVALEMEPRLGEALGGIVLMGGNAFVPGNATPVAEANIVNDPEAADIVFGAACPVSMCGLDVTEKNFMDGETLDRIASYSNRRARHLSAILSWYRDFYREWMNIDGIYVHDSTAIAYVLDPTLFETVKHPVRVDTTAGISRGKTWPAVRRSADERPWEGRPDVTICTGIDSAAATELELSALSR